MCIALTETHLSANIYDSEIHIAMYAVFLADRRERSHYWVALHIREDVTFKFSLWHTRSAFNTAWCTLYRPPDASNDDVKFGERFSMIKRVLTKLYLMSDLNFNIKWFEGNILSGMICKRTLPSRISTCLHKNAVHRENNTLPNQEW